METLPKTQRFTALPDQSFVPNNAGINKGSNASGPRRKKTLKEKDKKGRTSGVKSSVGRSPYW